MVLIFSSFDILFKIWRRFMVQICLKEVITLIEITYSSFNIRDLHSFGFQRLYFMYIYMLDK